MNIIINASCIHTLSLSGEVNPFFKQKYFISTILAVTFQLLFLIQINLLWYHLHSKYGMCLLYHNYNEKDWTFDLPSWRSYNRKRLELHSLVGTHKSIDNIKCVISKLKSGKYTTFKHRRCLYVGSNQVEYLTINNLIGFSQNRSKLQKTKECFFSLLSDMKADVRCFLAPDSAMMEIVPHLCVVMAPHLRPVTVLNNFLS